MKHSPLHQRLLRSLSRDGRHMRLVVSNEPVAIGPLVPVRGAASEGGEAA